MTTTDGGVSSASGPGASGPLASGPAAPGEAAARRPSRTVLAIAALAFRSAPGTLTLYAVLSLAAGVLPVVTAWLTKTLLDRLVAGAGPGPLVWLGGALALAGLVAGVTPQVTQYLRSESDRSVGVVAQDRLFRAAEGFAGLARFEDPHFLDRLRLAQQSAATAPTLAMDGVLGTARAVLTITGFLGSLLLLSPLIMVLVVASGIPTLVAELALSRRRARMFWDVGPTERRELFYGELLSSVEAAKEIRLFGSGRFFRHRMLRERRRANAARRAVDRREVVAHVGLAALTALVAGGGLIWAVSAAQAGRLTAGDVTMFVAAVTGVQSALASVANEAARSHQAILMFDHYLAVTTAGPDLPPPERPVPERPVPEGPVPEGPVSERPVSEGPRELAPLRHGITLRDVWFRYSAEHPWALNGVDLHIPHGHAVALVGLNGAGKSTLIKLLCRFYDPTHGAILWDGVDIRQIEVPALRRRIGAVFQDYMEYDMTAAENIALGDLPHGAGDEPADALATAGTPARRRVEQAAAKAGVDDCLTALPQGYDTLLSRMFFMESAKGDAATGVVLSGGQWQRLALARAFLRDRRDLMILDEPSAGLDAEAEHEIHASLRRHREGRTSLLVSHRLGTVRDADRIVVLAGGRVVEQGTHDALMGRDGEYARLFALQASDYQEPALDGRRGAPRA